MAGSSATTKADRVLAPFKDLGYVESTTASGGQESVGRCPLCGKAGKFYVNTETGQWTCKSGSCFKSGNLITFLEAWCEVQREAFPEPDFDALAADRQLPVERLQEAGIFFDGDRWVIPEFNAQGRIGNLRRYRIGYRGKLKLPGLKGVDTLLYGMEELADEAKADWPVWIVEGHWDRLALLELLLEAQERQVIVVAVPGADTFKEPWAEMLTGRDIVVVYDKDAAGDNGKLRAWRMLRDLAASFRALNWPVAAVEGYDIRDFYREDRANDFETLCAFVDEYEPPENEPASKNRRNVVASWPLLRDGGRPDFETDILPVYRNSLYLTSEHENALRILYAVVMANQITGDPVWIHLCAVPGSCKTELIMSAQEVGNVIARSSVTVAVLVSGWKSPGGADPSLLPKLFGNTFLLKDFTEFLALAPAAKSEIYSTLRGAYDGRVEKDFGNGIQRHYEGTFNMVSGVTPDIFRENQTSLGERFLIYHMPNAGNAGTAPTERNKIVRAAMNAVGREQGMRSDMREAAKSFLEYRIEPADLPIIPDEIADKVISLAELVAQLRANVARDAYTKSVLYRPQPEVATRLVKQLAKLLLGLGLLNNPPAVTDREYKIVQRVAVDSCVGWNFDMLYTLAQFEGQTLEEIAERANIPKTTLYERLQDLVLLGILETQADEWSGRKGAGRRPNRYFITTAVKSYWHKAALMNGKTPADRAEIHDALRIKRRRLNPGRTGERLKPRLVSPKK